MRMFLDLNAANNTFIGVDLDVVLIIHKCHYCRLKPLKDCGYYDLALLARRLFFTTTLRLHFFIPGLLSAARS